MGVGGGPWDAEDCEEFVGRRVFVVMMRDSRKRLLKCFCLV